MNAPQPFPATPAAKHNQGLAVTSFVLGLLSILCFLVLTGIPAIITGHMAARRAKREPQVYGGAGFAWAGAIMGYLSILLTVIVAVVAAIAIPAVIKEQEKARRGGWGGGGGNAGGGGGPASMCVNNMKQIGLAARIWSNDHKEIFPPDFRSMSNELGTPIVLICPSDTTKSKATDWSQFDPRQNVSYEYLLPNAKENDVMSEVVFRCAIHNNVGLGDGSVQQPGGRPRR